jgi:hypothetical protein
MPPQPVKGIPSVKSSQRKFGLLAVQTNLHAELAEHVALVRITADANNSVVDVLLIMRMFIFGADFIQFRSVSPLKSYVKLARRLCKV